MYNYDSEVLHYYGSSSMCTKRLIQNVYLIAPVPFVITLLKDSLLSY